MSEEEISAQADDETEETSEEATSKQSAEEAEGDEAAAEKTAATEADDTPDWSISESEARALKGLGIDEAHIAELAAIDSDSARAIVNRTTVVQRTIDQKFGEVGRLIRDVRSKPNEQASPKEPGGDAKVEFDPDYFGGDAAGALNKFFGEQLPTILQSMNESRQYREGEQAESLEREANGIFDSLDSKLYPDFGTGPMASLLENSPEYKARGEVIEEALVLNDGYARLRGEPLPFKDAIQRALNILHPEAAAKAQIKKMEKSAIKRNKSQLPRGAKRKSAGTKVNPFENTERVMRDKGMID